MDFAPIIKILLLSLNAMVPITLTAIGEILDERTGEVNIGLEGTLAIGALIAVVGAEVAGSPWMGLIAGLAVGALIGLIHGLVTIYGKGDQIISGVGINIFALGFVPFAIVVFWRTPGIRQLDPKLWMPQISFGAYGVLSWMVPATLLMAVLMWLLLHKSVIGLRVNAVGENPEAADVAGVHVEWVRMFGVICGTALVGLAGAYLSIDWNHVVTKEPAAGRGFISLANVVFSGLNPLLALLGGFIFGFFDTLGIWISTLPELNKIIPYHFVRMIPYIATLVVVAGAIGRMRFPKTIGLPYRRE